MKYVFIATLFFTLTANAHDTVTGTGNNVNICKPKVIVKSCGDSCKIKTQTITQVVEKPVIVEKVVVKEIPKPVIIHDVRQRNVYMKNKFSVLAGYGAKGNLKESSSSVETEDGLVLGAQYMRTIRQNVHGLVQIQTNRTLSIGVGLEFE